MRRIRRHDVRYLFADECSRLMFHWVDIITCHTDIFSNWLAEHRNVVFIHHVIRVNSQPTYTNLLPFNHPINFFYFRFVRYSDTAVSGFSYCGENGLNFSANSATFSEDDADFTPGRRNKPSRVSLIVFFFFSK